MNNPGNASRADFKEGRCFTRIRKWGFPGRNQMHKKHATLALSLAVILGLALAQPAVGATMQQHSIQAFRLLNNIGLIDALPARDSELAALDPFELANLVGDAAQRLIASFQGSGRPSLEVLSRHYVQSRGLSVPVSRIAESITLLEQSFWQQLDLLGKGPRFIAISHEALTGCRQADPSADAGSSGSVPNVYVPTGNVGDYRLISPRTGAKGQSDLPVLF